VVAASLERADQLTKHSVFSAEGNQAFVLRAQASLAFHLHSFPASVVLEAADKLTERRKQQSN